jgi:hypothetical protein
LSFERDRALGPLVYGGETATGETIKKKNVEHYYGSFIVFHPRKQGKLYVCQINKFLSFNPSTRVRYNNQSAVYCFPTIRSLIQFKNYSFQGPGSK